MTTLLDGTGLEIRILAIEQLIPADYNPRQALTANAYQKLKTSLQQFGLVEPLVWNQRTGHVVGGHARLRILKEWQVVQVPVSVVDLDENQEKALNIVLNNQEAQGRYDPSKLAELLTELEALPELEWTGFDAQTIRQLQLQPLANWSEERTTGRVEVTLEMTTEQYAQIQSQLDQLVTEWDLISHIHRR